MTTRACLAMTLFAACNAGGLPVVENRSSALGCHATAQGGFAAELGDVQWPNSGAFVDDARLAPINLNCGTANHGPLLVIGVPKIAGSFTSMGTLLTHPYAQASCDQVVQSDCNDWYQGSCSGVVMADAGRVGDWLRGTFICGSLPGAGDTSGSRSVTISDGEFDLQLQPAPPD